MTSDEILEVEKIGATHATSLNWRCRQDIARLIVLLLAERRRAEWAESRIEAVTKIVERMGKIIKDA